MPQFLISSKNVNVSQNKVFLTNHDADFKHLVYVLRIKPGEKVYFLDQNGSQYFAVFIEMKENVVFFEILNKKNCEKKYDFTLFQALPKANKMDFIIEKAVELGITKIVPILTKNVVVNLDEKSGLHKLERWQKIALSAVKQSKNPIIPTISIPQKFENILKISEPNSLKLIAWEKGENPLKPILKNYREKYKNINLIVGAEGGFEDFEIEQAKKNNWQDFHLNGNILRVETAALTLVSIIEYAFDLI